MTRPDRTTLELIAFRKKDGEPKWNRISEVHALPSNIMLPTYVAPNHIVLPPLPAEDPLADGVGGECHSMES
jgi:hypothetical protein